MAPCSGREMLPTELPDATIDDTPEAVRAIAGTWHATILRLTPADIAELLAGKLIAIANGPYATQFLAYEPDR